MNLNSSTTLGFLVEHRPREQELERLRPEFEQMQSAKKRLRSAVALLDKACGVFVASRLASRTWKMSGD